jgi:hypothetical protein
LSAADPTPEPAIVREIADELKTRPGMTVQVRTQDRLAEYTEGQAVAFVVRADRDCHIAVFCHQSNDTTLLLFPNEHNVETFIRQGAETAVPGCDKAGFVIEAGEPFGRDHVQVVSCTSRPELERLLLERRPVAGTPLAAVSRGVLVRGLKVKPAPESAAGEALWGEAHLSVLTRAR